MRDFLSTKKNLLLFIIPDSVKVIREDAFFDVKNVNYNGTAEGSPWGAKKINGVKVRKGK